MNIGPKMAFIVHVYRMTEAENADDIENDREMVRAGLISERERQKRSSTRALARKIRQRDDLGNWPRDAEFLFRRLRDGKVGSFGEVTKDARDGDEIQHLGRTKH